MLFYSAETNETKEGDSTWNSMSPFLLASDRHLYKWWDCCKNDYVIIIQTNTYDSVTQFL